MKIIGIVLIAFGVFVLVAGGIRYTDKDTVVDIGPLKAQVEERKTLPLSPVLGVVSIAAGTALFIAGARTRRGA